MEAIVGIALLAIGIAGASRLALATSHLSDVVNDRQTAVQLAKDRIERMSQANFDDLSQWAVDNMVVDDSGQPDTEGSFKLSTAVTFPQTNLAEIAIDVWTRNRKTMAFDHSPENITTFLTTM